jgi:hemin uptake protein HemP
MEIPSTATANDPALNARPDPQSRTLASADILQGERKVLITHGNEIYRLLVTRNDKLILQK